MSSAKPLKTFLFSRPQNFRFRGFQCYQGLAADFVSRCFSALFSGRWSEVGQGFSLPNNSRYHRFSFLENQIPIMSPSGLNRSGSKRFDKKEFLSRFREVPCNRSETMSMRGDRDSEYHNASSLAQNVRTQLSS
jgi:hypothetical protein